MFSSSTHRTWSGFGAPVQQGRQCGPGQCFSILSNIMYIYRSQAHSRLSLQLQCCPVCAEMVMVVMSVVVVDEHGLSVIMSINVSNHGICFAVLWTSTCYALAQICSNRCLCPHLVL